MLDLIRWWLAVEALCLLALPLTVWFFRRLPDRGYSFAKPFGLLLTGYGAWLLSMLGLGALGWLQLVAVALGVAALGGALLGRSGWRAALHDLRNRSGWIVFQEALFVAALFGAIWLGWHQFWGLGVAISHTEQPMDLTFISGILASPQFPPQDPWLAPYPINYYYLGYLLVAALIRLSGVTVGVGYTLGLATIFALTATGVAGIVRNLIDLTEGAATEIGNREQGTKNREQGIGDRSGRRVRWGRWLAPLAGVALVLLMGNQAGALQVLAGSEKVVAMTPDQIVAAIGNNFGARQTINLPPPFPASDFGNQSQIAPADKGDRQEFDRWWPSRAVWDDLRKSDGTTVRAQNITEFPLFSFLLGDLHPHVLSLPWTLLALALALNVLNRQRAPDFRSRAGFAELIITGIVLGGLYMINSWDLPTYLLIYLGALTLLYLRLAGSARAFFWPHWLQQAGATILASYLLYLPFHMSFVAPTEGFPLGIAPARTGLFEFGVIFGLFGVPLLAYVASMALRAQPIDGISAPRSVAFGAAILILFLVLGAIVGWPLFALLLLALAALLIAYQCREQPATAFALGVFAVGSLVVWGTDVVFLRDHFAGSLPRMNTIFKFYYQVWLLWGTLAAYALWALLRRVRWTTALWAAPFAVLLGGALVYPVLAPAANPPSRTIDALAFLQQAQPDEAAAIAWVRQATVGDAIILQAPGESYKPETARISSATGRPTVIGWAGSHEGLWRRGQPDLRDQIGKRVEDVTTLYTTTDPQLAQSLLARYNVRYVVVGPTEQALANARGAPPEALTKFAGWMQPVFQQGNVTIYGQR